MLKIILRSVLEVNVASWDVMEFVSEILFCKEVLFLILLQSSYAKKRRNTKQVLFQEHPYCYLGTRS